MPPVYFGIYSYSIAQTALYVPEGHFPHRIGGNTKNLADWHDATACSPTIAQTQEVGDHKGEPKAERTHETSP